MEKTVQQNLLQLITREWESLSVELKPWGVWIRQYAPIPIGADCEIDDSSLPLQTWFLDRQGIRQRSVWEFKRLQVVHWEQPWCKKANKEISALWTPRHYEIGLAAIAEYEDSPDVYIETIWAGLYGKRLRVKFDENGKVIDRNEVWVA